MIAADAYNGAPAHYETIETQCIVDLDIGHPETNKQTHGLLLILATTTRSAGRLFSVVAGQGASLETPRLVDSYHDVPRERGASHVILFSALLSI